MNRIYEETTLVENVLSDLWKLHYLREPPPSCGKRLTHNALGA